MKGSKREIKWNLIAKLKGSRLRRDVLKALRDKPKTPQEIERTTSIKFSHVSDKLKELSGLGLVECITPEVRKGKLYAITPSGKRILQNIQ